MSEKDFDILQNRNNIIYNHHFGFFREDFNKEKNLNDLFKVVSISEGKNINSFEGKNDSIIFFGSQFHPEKIPNTIKPGVVH